MVISNLIVCKNITYVQFENHLLTLKVLHFFVLKLYSSYDLNLFVKLYRDYIDTTFYSNVQAI